MRFGRTLRISAYEPWRSHYLDYAKLKRLLREDELEDDDPNANLDDQARRWTDEDESAFVEELLNVQLEKVHKFHADTIKQLRERTSECESKLEHYARISEADGAPDNGGEQAVTISSVEQELDR